MKRAADKKNEENSLIKTGNKYNMVLPKPLIPAPKLKRQVDLFEFLVYKVPSQPGMCSKTLFQKTNKQTKLIKQKKGLGTKDAWEKAYMALCI